MEDLSVSELVERARQGDDSAWAGLVERYSALVYSMARRNGLGHAASADVSQTTWLKLAENLGKIREPARVGGWLATTARNESINMIRRTRNEVSSNPDEERLAGPDDASDRALANERSAILNDVIGRLSERCQTLLRLLFGDPPMDYQEIAGVLGIAPGSIGPTRARCLEKARAAMGSRL